MYLDNGPQLVASSKELSNMTKEWDWDKLKHLEQQKDLNGILHLLRSHG